MTSVKTLALAAAAVAGLGMFSSTDAEARGFRGGGFHGGGFRSGGLHLGGGRHFGHRHHFHRHHHHHRHGFWRHGRGIGLGVAVVGSSCYRYRWIDTPYGVERRLVNICVY
jgi:hypothetical protein